MQDAHPPAPGPVVQPNFLPVMEALGDVTFPIAKSELLEQVEGGTVLFQGRNVDLRDLLKEVHDDFFDSEEELEGALERLYAPSETDADAEPPISPLASAQRPTGPDSLSSFVEPEG
ncbi:MAG TPA: hypothetical protein VM370_06365 [Candidatus Thermoplasmatota archaeon]|nr:hypothetical protein [Candidatus Thermoplasmatota archaeon]